MEANGGLALLALLVRWRLVVAVALSMLFSVLAVYPAAWNSGIDWDLLGKGGRTLLSSAGLHTYARVPGLQAGPLSLVVTGALVWAFGAGATVVGHLLLFAELPVLLFVLERAQAKQPSDAARRRTLVAGAVLAPVWASLAGGTLHLDDGMALLGAVGALFYVRRNRGLAAALCAGSAAAAKPWALGAIALLWGLQDRRLRSAVLAAAVPVVVWLPLVFDRANLHTATSMPFTVSTDAPMRLVRVLPAVMPSWQRPFELAVILAVAGAVAARGSWRDAFAASMVARLLVEVATLTYYDVDTLVAVVAADLVTSRVPWRSGLVWLAVEAGGLLPWPAKAGMRLFVLAIVVASYAFTPSGDGSRVPARIRRRIDTRRPLLAS